MGTFNRYLKLSLVCKTLSSLVTEQLVQVQCEWGNLLKQSVSRTLLDHRAAIYARILEAMIDNNEVMKAFRNMAAALGQDTKDVWLSSVKKFKDQAEPPNWLAVRVL